MIQTVEAVIDKQGKVRLLQQVSLPENRWALVTILEEPIAEVSETTLLMDKKERSRYERK